MEKPLATAGLEEKGTRRARRIGIPLPPPPPIIQLRRRPRLSPPPLASVASPGNKLYGKLCQERYYDVVLGPANISIPLEEGARTTREAAAWESENFRGAKRIRQCSAARGAAGPQGTASGRASKDNAERAKRSAGVPQDPRASLVSSQTGAAAVHLEEK